jgi:predicted dehydrogenase
MELVAVADSELEPAQGAAEAWHARPFQDAAEMISETRPEAVIICTPPDTHRDLTITALESGAHVLCEKPLTLTVDGAGAMFDAATRADRHLMMASKFRHARDVVKGRALLASGAIGQVLAYENEFCAPVDMRQRWNSNPNIAGGGVLIDNGTHSVDIIRYLLGPIVEALATRGVPRQSLEVEDSCRLLCRVQDGTLASVDLSWSYGKADPWYIAIYGTEGALRIGWKQSDFRQGETAEWTRFGEGYDKFIAFGQQLENFVAAIRGEAQPLIEPEAAVDSVRVVQAAYRSLQTRAWEKPY